MSGNLKLRWQQSEGWQNQRRESFCRSTNRWPVLIWPKGEAKKTHLSAILRPFIKWCLENQVRLQVQWVPSEEMQADNLSRWVYDKGDYTLDGNLFKWVKNQFYPWCKPKVDMFASPGNAQIFKFVTRWPHHQAFLVDAWNDTSGIWRKFMQTHPRQLSNHVYTVCVRIPTRIAC